MEACAHVCPLCSHCPLHPLIDDSVWHFDSLSHTLHPGPDSWHLLNVIMCSYTWCGPFALDRMGPLGHFLSARKCGFTVHRAEIHMSTFKGAVPPSDGHGNLVMVMDTRFGHDPQAFPRNAIMGMLFYSTFFQTACAFGPYCLLRVTIT